jgi:hypothetical protein
MNGAPIMLGDDELRAQLFRETVERGMPSQANAVLEHIRPTMRRARQRRIVGLIGASCTLVLGVGAVAQVIRSSNDDTIQTSLDEIPDVVDGALPDRDASDRGVAPTTDDDRSTSTTESAVGSVDTPHPTVDDREDLVGDDGSADADDTGEVEGESASGTSVATSTGSPVTPGATTTTVLQTTGVPPSAATAVPTTTMPATTTSTTVGPEFQTFSSRCGEVDALVGSAAVELIDVRPAAGYSYKVEDADHGTITIKFTGSGEDCDVKVGPSGRHPEGD